MNSDSSSADTSFHIITACYGGRFWSAVPAWAAHLRALCEAPIEVVSLDGQSFDEPDLGVSTVQTDVGEHIDPGLRDMTRLVRIRRRLERDEVCVQIDVDVALKRDISTLVDLPYDLVISRAYAFPQDVSEVMGFVACTGFYIAKPGSRSFCDTILDHARAGTYESYFDQVIINRMLLEAREQGHWTTRVVEIAGESLAMDEFESCGCRIGVLPRETIFRSDNLDASTYGAHHPALLGRFIPAEAAGAAAPAQDLEAPL